jgi:hypothetical protein
MKQFATDTTLTKNALLFFKETKAEKTASVDCSQITKKLPIHCWVFENIANQFNSL